MKKERHVCARRRVGEAAGPEGRARRPQACRNSGSASAAEAFMNNAGENQFSSKRPLRQAPCDQMLHLAKHADVSSTPSCPDRTGGTGWIGHPPRAVPAGLYNALGPTG
ncbi:hypothetical protein NSPZN2_10104 [Nitrospira defluvii]|uniref:Uncharacterized protein n=1 Tax=Nitrospira defluvii TaxID=330214 RepID=A0ABM8QBT2_9BACT|nr:hypothetical protein NSPZN2_10104 [Nitrospira defluvii]